MRPVFAAILLAMSVSVSSQAEVIGTWKTEEGENGGYALVQIHLCEDGTGTFCGTILDIIGNETTSVGLPIITGMLDRGDGKYRSGRIWAPDQDRWYQARMNLESSHQLSVYGCVAGGLICRGQDWIRVE